MKYDSLVQTIGNTPMVRLNKMFKDLPCSVYAKLESFNPGHSNKDRIALFMIEKAEKSGLIHPGDTLVEATSGNTGFSLAMISLIKGYKCILTVTDKIADEKVDMIKSLGAEVIKCPKNAKPTDPESYYKVAEKIARETPHCYYLNQNFDSANMEAHYEGTGREIWKDSEGKVTFVIGATSTGGTLSGVGKFCKEHNPLVNVIGIDSFGSVLKKFKETHIYDLKDIKSSRIDGVGKNIIPGSIDFDVIDEFVTVSDKDAALRTIEVCQSEGIMAGYSSGAIIEGMFQIKDRFTLNDFVVLIFPDHGYKYLGTVYNEKWRSEQFFSQDSI
ncbi:MAG: cysteine synthase family protein [Saprospiraceae bacterium]